MPDFYYRFMLLAPPGSRLPLPIGPGDDPRELVRRLLLVLRGHELFQGGLLDTGVKYGATRLFLKKAAFKTLEARGGGVPVA